MTDIAALLQDAIETDDEAACGGVPMAVRVSNLRRAVFDAADLAGLKPEPVEHGFAPDTDPAWTADAND